MQGQTWQIQQQLQRVQQICTETVQINQQAVQQLQQIQQQVTQIGNLGAQNFGATQTQGSYYGFTTPGLNAVMQADRQITVQENTPSYHNYNTQVPQYSSAQSVNYSSSLGSSAPLQNVMMADQQAGVSGGRTSYGSVGGSQYGGAGTFGSTWM